MAIAAPAAGHAANHLDLGRGDLVPLDRQAEKERPLIDALLGSAHRQRQHGHGGRAVLVADAAVFGGCPFSA
jgi:hypothetical protein